MGKTIYLECNAGISGDMTVAALLDLGADRDYLMKALNSLPVSGYTIEITKVKKVGIECTDFNVLLDEEHENHDHDMEYLHGHNHDHDHHQVHEHEHSHEHDHKDNYKYSCEYNHKNNHQHSQGHNHHHEHRGMKDIVEIIDGSEISFRAKKIAKDIFNVLAQVESKAHGVKVNQVHFHEVGAVDSIVDVVAVAVCLDNLDVDKVIVTRLCEGTGTVRCAHGILPVPVPAVANIIESYNLPIRIMDVQGEFVTPTGAAIVAAIATGFKLPSDFRVRKIGMGAGKRNYERASILRAMWIEEASAEESPADENTQNSLYSNSEDEHVIYKLESNIDDCTGEALGFVMDMLLESGARDVHYTPVFMKKNRPGWQINVICMPKDIEKLEGIIFKHTTTIGIRRIKMERSVLERTVVDVATPWGIAQVKVCKVDGETKYYPEYDSIEKICKSEDVSYQQVFETVINNVIK